MKRYYILFAVVVLLFAIPIGYFTVGESEKEPFDLTMYGAEIRADGSIIQKTEFTLKGYLVKDDRSELQPYSFYIEPFRMKYILNMNFDMDSYGEELSLGYIGNVHAPNYMAHWFMYSRKSNAPELVTLHWCSRLCCCIIEVEGRYFVGSTRENATVQQILDTFPEVELQAN